MTASPPIEGFAPELMDLLLRGARERVEINLGSDTRARHIKNRLYMLRKKMRTMAHPEYPLVVRAAVVLGCEKDRNLPGYLIIQPADAEILADLRAGGVDLDALRRNSPIPKTPSERSPPPPAPDGNMLDQIFRDFNIDED